MAVLAVCLAAAGPVTPQGEQDSGSQALFESGNALAAAGQADKAREAWNAALEEAQDAQTRVAILEALGESYQYGSELARAEASFRSALETGEAAWGESLQAAGTMTRLGNVLRLRQQFDAAKQLQERALEIRQRLAPDSLEVADSLHHLFLLAIDDEDVEAMSDLSRRAMAIHERRSSDTLALADTLSDLGYLAMYLGYTYEAVARMQQAVAILERQAPGSIPLATMLGRLGLMHRLIGDTEPAAEALRRALTIREKLAPDSLGTAVAVGNLGVLLRDRGDLDKAAELFQRTMEISEKAVPNGIRVAETLNALASVASLRGDREEAWKLHSRALEIFERLGFGSKTAETLWYLGMVAEARGDLKLALDLHHRARVLRERVAPDSIEEAQTLHQLGRLYRRTGHPDLAAQYLGRAVEALEAQMGRLGGPKDLQAAFRASHEDIYHDAIEVEVERGHAAEAFHLVERSRARSFLDLLAERDLAFSGELPPDLERSRRDNASSYDQALRKLGGWTPAAGEDAREALHRELDRLRRERAEIAEKIRTASPRLAALRQPQPLDLNAARKVLDPGTLALSYSVGKERTVLFALTREGGLRVEVLPLGEERLRADVERLLELVRQPAPVSDPSDLALALYRALIGPLADLVERSERVLILPDGPLHRLPFGALVR
ncbi:MAG TPA: tetratricopeptide repeat protein, partial [Thermoanaerobaculia bacterium]|nr:tetratricopeptide repeat protein [Thermoanaerobaculia bacterium]